MAAFVRRVVEKRWLNRLVTYVEAGVVMKGTSIEIAELVKALALLKN